MERLLLVLSLLLSHSLSAHAASEGGLVEFHRGKLAYEARNYRRAGRDFAAAGRAGYEPGPVHLWMARCYIRMKSEARALDQLERARAAGLEDPEVEFEMARIFLTQGDLEAGRKELEKLPPDWESEPRVQILYAHIAVYDLDWDKAEEAIQKAVSRYPGYSKELIQVMPEDRQEDLMALAEKHLEIAAQEPEAPPKAPTSRPQAASAAKVPPASEPTDSTPGSNVRASGMTVFGSKHAFTPKTGTGKSLVLRRWGTDKPPRENTSGPFILSKPTYRGSDAKVGN